MAIINWIDDFANWTVAADWSGGVKPGASDDVTIAFGNPDVTTKVGTVKSVTTLTSSGRLSFDNGGVLVTTGAFNNGGSLELDASAGEGGSKLAIGGTLTNDGSLRIGNSRLSAATTVTAAKLANMGTIDIEGSQLATLNVTAAAGFGSAGVLTGSVLLSGAALIEFASGQIQRIDASANLRLVGPHAFIADAGALGSNSALNGLTTNAGMLALANGASLATSAGLNNSGSLLLDAGSNEGFGAVTIGGVLTNTGVIQVGASFGRPLAGAATLTVAGLTNIPGSAGPGNPGGGQISVNGGATTQATLNVTGAAGFGTAGAVSGTVQLSGDSLIQFASGQITKIAANAILLLAGAKARVALGSSPAGNSALAGLANNAGELQLANGASVTTTTGFVNDGRVSVDEFGEGGSSLKIGGLLTNHASLEIGNSAITTADTVTATGIDNTNGFIDLVGSTTIQATLNLTGAAGFGTLGVLSGSVVLSGDSVVEFASGQISSIAANGQLQLSGAGARIADIGPPATSSALTGLAGNAGSFFLENGARVASSALTNIGFLGLDDRDGATGGSSLKVGGALTNKGNVNIGNNALAAAATLTAAGLANSGTMTLVGNGAKFATLIVNGVTSNSGSLDLGDAKVTTTGAVNNSGFFSVDTLSSGGSTVSFGGR